MKHLLVIITMLVCCLSVSAANKWKTYLSYHNATKSVIADGKIYTIASGGLYYYIPGEQKVHEISKSTGLSDVNITHFVFNKELSRFIIVYSNYNIDIIDTNGGIINIPQYKNSNLQDKTINNVTTVASEAYLATNFGVVVINMKTGVIANTYNIGISVTGATATEEKIYATTKQGVYEGNIKDNLLDKKNWNRLTTLEIPCLANVDGDLYTNGWGQLFAFDESNGSVTNPVPGQFDFINLEGDLIIMGNKDAIFIQLEDKSFKTIPFKNDFTWISYDGTSFWGTRKDAGLQQIILANDSMSLAGTPIIPVGPIRNYTYSLSYTPDKRLLVGGGSLNYTGKNYEGTAMIYDGERWLNFQEDSIAQVIGYGYHNVTGVAEDPNDKTHHFVSAACGGILEFRNGKFIKLYDCDNSPIMSILPDDHYKKYYTRTSGITYDKSGNLWVLNNQVDTLLHIIKTDGKWKSFSFSEVAGYPTFDKIYFDSRGWAWMTHRRKTSSHKPGLLCLNYNGTIDNTSDDIHRFQYNLDGNDEINQVYDVVEDRDGIIWIATSMGPFILRNPLTFFDNNTNFERIIVPRNDGTNNGDYLLAGVPIMAIAIDGGNRKWFATSGNGVYLVSADGLTTIEHFTKENSPLLSNTVYSIAINGETGEVMFGTDEGLVSYLADATDPKEPLSKSNLIAYPNPVRPEYEGNVTVKGFSFNSDVKVTTVGGQVIYKGTSVGGTFTWNCRTSAGKRVSTGVYYIIGSDENGKKGATAKVLVVK